MKRRPLGPGLAVLLAACSADELHRFAGVPQGTLVVGLGMPMRDVARRSTVKLHKLPTLGLSSGTYADGNAHFDLELAGSSLRFHGCSMYSIDFEGPDEIVTGINVHITPSRHRWPALQRELRETAAKLKADGWDPRQRDGHPTLESFLARDGSMGSTSSGRIASFEWSKGEAMAVLSADRAWDSARFWSSLVVVGAELHDPEKTGVWWPSEFPVHPDARGLCSRNTVQSKERKPEERAWSMYATRDEPAIVVAFYAERQGLKPEPGAMTLKLQSRDGKTQLAIHPIGGGYTEDCGVRPTGWAKTILIASEAP
jgi:hypothetical protein